MGRCGAIWTPICADFRFWADLRLQMARLLISEAVAFNQKLLASRFFALVCVGLRRPVGVPRWPPGGPRMALGGVPSPRGHGS